MPTPTGIDLLDTGLVPAIQTLNPGVSPMDPNTTPIADAMALAPDVANPFAPSMPELDVPSTVPNMVPADPSAEATNPDSALKDAAAAHVLGVDAPQVADVKVGTNTTSTSKTIQSDESKAAANDLYSAKSASDAAFDAEAASAAKSAEVDAARSEADHKVIAEVETARATAQMINQQKFTQDIADIDAKVSELANYKPETFWGSKSTSDKVAASISVGLGSFAQSLTGSGQNVGTMLLNRQMDEFDKNQQAQYNAKLEGIKGMRLSLSEKEKLAADAERTFDAQKLAARAQVAAQYDKASAMAKTPGVIAAIQQKKAKVDMDVAKTQQEIAAKYETRVNENQERDVLKQMEMKPGMGPDGKPIKLTDANNKARFAYADIAASNQALKGLDVDKLALSPNYQGYLNESREDTSLKDAPFKIGSALAGIRDATMGSPAERLAKQDPDAARLDNAINNWTRGVIRYKSGAAIAHSEQNEERNQYWPVLGDTPQTLKDKAEARKNIEKAARDAGAL